jgi:SAM-dependent methyltransferase
MPASLQDRIIRLPLRFLSMRAAFRHYYHARSWGPQEESASGPASSLERTRAVRAALPSLLERLGARSLLDIPCGDFHWMSHVDLPIDTYTGVDIVSELTDENRRRYANPARNFLTLDITADPLPRADVVLCRDCLVHLSLRKALRAVRNIVASQSTWLLTTTFPGEVTRNRDVLTGGWRPLDLRLPPFSFPEPNVEIDECWPQWPRRRLSLWTISELPQFKELQSGQTARPLSAASSA